MSLLLTFLFSWPPFLSYRCFTALFPSPYPRLVF